MTPDDGSTAASGQIVPFSANVRLGRGEAYPLEVKARCFVLYATAGARNGANTSKLYAEEHKDEACPSKETINLWAREERWGDQADDLWRQTRGRTQHELQILSTANAQLAQMRLNALLMGTDERPYEERVITLKAIEVANKAREKMPDLGRVQPPDAEADVSNLTREEREAAARQNLVQRDDVRRRGT